MRKAALGLSVKVLVIILLRISNVSSTENETKDAKFNYWTEFLKSINLLKTKCSKQSIPLDQCFMRQSFWIIDDFLSSDVIHVSPNLFLAAVKDKTSHQNLNTKRTLILEDFNKLFLNKNMTWHEWSSAIVNRFDKAMQSYNLYLDIFPNTNVTSTARHRRRHQMLPMMILGVLIFGIIVIPTGFQFLAVLGGKAFLMAKMALLLASINGLKRVASSGVHYGLYHTDPGHYPHYPPPPAPHVGASHYWYDRDGENSGSAWFRKMLDNFP